MHKPFLFTLAYIIQSVGSQQYASFQQEAPARNKICSDQSNISLVEQFFNLIFTEFHNHQPVCICVQMCPGHPTYCYPNGCFRKTDLPSKKTREPRPPNPYKRTAQVYQLQDDKTKPMSFLEDGPNSFWNSLINSKLAEAKQISKYNEGYTYKEINRDPFRDRYQSIFKYRKSPKVHLRYNLREQVRNKKSDLIRIDKIDVAKTKWPIYDSKQYYVEKGKRGRKHFRSLRAVNSYYPSKFIKRDTRLIAPKEPILEEDENETDDVALTLENLIENLIETSFGPLANETELDLNVSVDYDIENNATTVEPINEPYKRSYSINSIIDNNTILNSINSIIDNDTNLNETNNFIPMNNTNQTTNEYIYRDNNQSKQIYKNKFNEMIASLSKKIDINNNNSIEIMEYALGNLTEEIYSEIEKTETTLGPSVEDFFVTETTNIDLNGGNATSKTTTQISEKIQVTEKETTTTQKETDREQRNTTRKSHRRLVRKLKSKTPNKRSIRMFGTQNSRTFY